MKTYDYVVIGAGSSGCVIASRLAEDPRTRVLVLDAGGNDDSALLRKDEHYCIFAAAFRTISFRSS